MNEIDLKNLSEAERREFAGLLGAKDKRGRENRLTAYKPYPKQMEFHELGATMRERMFFAGTQSGKTTAAAHEIAMHLTGIYPKGWKGRRFDKPIKAWACGQGAHALKDAMQSKLLGTNTPFSNPTDLGTGAIPKHCIEKLTPSRGVYDVCDTIQVKHISGGISTLTIKSYEAEQMKFAGASVDVVWLDEEPPMGIYIECLGRVTATKGIVFVTFSPINGETSLTSRFRHENAADRAMVVMSLYDVADAPNGHLSRKEVEEQLARLPDWEREARVWGLPSQGHGRLVTFAENTYVVEPFEIPAYWKQIIGLDVGFAHNTAAIALAFDPDRQIAYAVEEYNASGLTPAQHAPSLLMMGAGALPVAWPHDAVAFGRDGAEAIAVQYKKLGLKMLSTPARSEQTGNSLWASATDLVMRLQHGGLKVFSTCTQLRSELVGWHQKDNRIVTERDDAISALRYAVMMLRHAKQPDWGPKGGPGGAGYRGWFGGDKHRNGQIADGAVGSDGETPWGY